MKEDLISITELAKIRKVTTETLRHYDRIGLFKPDYIDPENNYRYYSILQYEKLGTIKELRQLGMSLSEIKDYFSDRNLKKSVSILKNQHELLVTEIMEKRKLEKSLAHKLEFLEKVIEQPKGGELSERELPNRYMITYGCKVERVKELAFELTRLETQLEDVAPILATNRVGSYTTDNIFDMETDFGYVPMLLCNKNDYRSLNKNKADGRPRFLEIPGGTYICVRYNGKFGTKDEIFHKIRDYLNKNGYIINGKIYHIYQIDVTLTSNFLETAIEIQVPVGK